MNATDLRKLRAEAGVLRERIGDGTASGMLEVYKHVSRARRLLLLVEESLEEAADAVPFTPSSE